MASAESLECEISLGFHPSCLDSGVRLGSISVLNLKITRKRFHGDSTQRRKTQAGNRNVDS